MFRKFSLIGLCVLILTGLGPPIIANENLAEVMVKKGLSKIVKPDLRKNILIDVETEGSSAGIKPKLKTTDARLEVRGVSMVELYQAFRTRYEFYIDMNEST